MKPDKVLRRLQTENRALKAAVDARNDWLRTSHTPKALVDLARALTTIHHMGDPMPTQNWSSSRAAEIPEPGAATRRYRNAETRALAKIRQLTASLEAAIENPTAPRPKPSQCPTCGRHGRFGATHCDRDGTPLTPHADNPTTSTNMDN